MPTVMGEIKSFRFYAQLIACLPSLLLEGRPFSSDAGWESRVWMYYVLIMHAVNGTLTIACNVQFKQSMFALLVPTHKASDADVSQLCRLPSSPQLK